MGDVPSQSVMLGAGGQASASTILALANAAQKQNLGGIMVWYASVIDSATGKVGNQYSGGSMDASIQSDVTKATWKQALDIMTGKTTLAIQVEPRSESFWVRCCIHSFFCQGPVPSGHV